MPCNFYELNIDLNLDFFFSSALPEQELLMFPNHKMAKKHIQVYLYTQIQNKLITTHMSSAFSSPCK